MSTHASDSGGKVPAGTTTVLLAAIDASAGAELVVSQAAALARQTPGAQLHLVHVYVELPLSAPPLGGPALNIPTTTELFAEAREYFEGHIRAASEKCGAKVIGHLVAGTPWREVVQLAADIDADLIVIGTHDYKGVERLILGSVAEVIVRKSSCPVLVVRPKDHHRPPNTEILPPCPQCLEVQKASGGKTMWCERHSHKHPHAHLHYEVPQGFALGSSRFE